MNSRAFGSLSSVQSTGLYCPVKPRLCRHHRLVTRAEISPNSPEAIRDKLQGARDPTSGELGSQFTAKPLSQADTMHIIRPPMGMDKVTGLRSRKCRPCEAGKTQALDSATCNAMRNQVPGWRLVKDAAGHLCIQQEWKVTNFLSGVEFFKRVGALAEEEGHHPDLHLEGWNNVKIQLSTHSVGGLTENDFIMATKINDMDTSDLRPRPKAKPRNFV